VVNSENLNNSINHSVKVSPYLSCLNFIVKASYNLIDGGESQFIDFIHAKSIKPDDSNLNLIRKLIEEFDFSLGVPLARQYLSYLLFKDFSQTYIELNKEIKSILILNAKKGINTINQIPSSTVKCSRALILLEQIEKDINIDINLDYVFAEVEKIALSNLSLIKDNLFAPLTFWQEDSIKFGFYSLLNKLEALSNSYFYFLNVKDENFKLNLLSIKESILDNDINDIYNKSIFLSKLVNLIIKNQVNHKNEINFENKYYENILFIERLSYQLSRKNESIENIKYLKEKLQNHMENNICLNELIDEEIHNINNSISKDNITRARLEIRLNDTEYPLSVAYREYIKSALQYLEE
jgi:hypothetical protein